METDQSLEQERRQDTIERLHWHHSVAGSLCTDFLLPSLTHTLNLLPRTVSYTALQEKHTYMILSTHQQQHKDNSFWFNCPQCVKEECVLSYCEKNSVMVLNICWTKEQSVSVLMYNTPVIVQQTDMQRATTFHNSPIIVTFRTYNTNHTSLTFTVHDILDVYVSTCVEGRPYQQDKHTVLLRWSDCNS